MSTLTDFHAEEFTISSGSDFGSIHNGGLHASDESPADWVVDTDEAGNHISCVEALCDYLQRDPLAIV